MQRIRKTYWAWTQEEWLEVICNSEGEFRRRFEPEATVGNML